MNLINDEKLDALFTKEVKQINASGMMALAMMKAGNNRLEILNRTGITNHAYSKLYETYQEKNLDVLTMDLVNTWSMILLAKTMGTTEKAIDKIDQRLDEDNMKDAKLGADTFEKLFNSFRLSTGKSTENISSVATKFNEVIESKRKLIPANQSLKEVDAITVQ